MRGDVIALRKAFTTAFRRVLGRSEAIYKYMQTFPDRFHVALFYEKKHCPLSHATYEKSVAMENYVGLIYGTVISISRT